MGDLTPDFEMRDRRITLVKQMKSNPAFMEGIRQGL
jgi:hypothetical protein